MPCEVCQRARIGSVDRTLSDFTIWSTPASPRSEQSSLFRHAECFSHLFLDRWNIRRGHTVRTKSLDLWICLRFRRFFVKFTTCTHHPHGLPRGSVADCFSNQTPRHQEWIHSDRRDAVCCRIFAVNTKDGWHLSRHNSGTPVYHAYLCFNCVTTRSVY